MTNPCDIGEGAQAMSACRECDGSRTIFRYVWPDPERDSVEVEELCPHCAGTGTEPLNSEDGK